MRNTNFRNNKKRVKKIMNNYIFVEEKDGKKYFIDTIPKRFGVYKTAVLNGTDNYELVGGDKEDFLPEAYRNALKEYRKGLRQK